MKSKSKETISFNYKLDEITTKLNHTFDRLKFKDNVSVERIKSIFLGKDKVKMTFLQMMEEYNRNAEKAISVNIVKATYWRFDRVYRYFKEFLKKEFQVNDISLTEINYQLVDKFVDYLKIEKKYSQNSMIS